MFDCAERNAPFYLPKDGLMPLQLFHVEDLCRFIEIIFKITPEQRIFNVGNQPTTVKEWVKKCYAAVGKVPEFINVIDSIEQRNYFPFYDYGYVLDVTKQNELMPGLLPLDTGLCRAYAWYKDNRSFVNRKNYLDFIDKNFKK